MATWWNQAGSSAARRPRRRQRAGGGLIIGLAVVGSFLPLGRGRAQTSYADQWRLTVRPRAIVGTRTERAGWHALAPGGPKRVTYVPLQCVGTRRCPLLVSGGGYLPMLTATMIAAADKYGFILTVPRSGIQTADVDAHLKAMLGRYAIDPDKIAILGHCGTGSPAVAIGSQNPEVFSRVISLSPAPANEFIAKQAAARAPNPKFEFLFIDGIDNDLLALPMVQQIRRGGHRVKLGLGVRNHNYAEEDGEAIGRWLYESWRIPNLAARTAPDTLPEVLLTSDAIAKLTDFWTRFQALRTDLDHERLLLVAERRLHLREVAVPIGQKAGREYADVLIMDLPMLAPEGETTSSFGALLQLTKLTAQEHDAYRVALMSALYTKWYPALAATVDSTSVLGRNMAFLGAHPNELQQLTKQLILRLP